MTGDDAGDEVRDGAATELAAEKRERESRTRFSLGAVVLVLAVLDINQLLQAPGLGHAFFDATLVLAGVVMFWQGWRIRWGPSGR